jgi:hypothetical protein
MEDKTLFLIGAGAAAVVLAVLLVKKGASVVGDAVGDAANAINPLNNDNIINRGFHSVYDAVTDGQGTLGTDIYDALHPEQINAPGQPGYDKTKPGTDIYGNPDPVAGWMYKITSFVWD